MSRKDFSHNDEEITDNEAMLCPSPSGKEPEEKRDSSFENWQKILRERFGSCSDEDVVKLAQQGDVSAEEYLLGKYKNLVRTRARSYFLIGADHEDIVQEGMFGLFKAIRDYQSDRLSSFHAFAELCIVRQMITAVKTATRMKHTPLNTYVSLNKPIFDEDSGHTLMDVLTENHVQNPEELIISRENALSFQQEAVKILSPLEQRVLSDYLEGKSYQDIAKILGRSPKSIDNALQRVKKKLEKSLHEIRSGDDE